MKVGHIQKLLVANRGDPVFRAISSCRLRHIEVVALYVAEDQNADWVANAEMAFEIPSYLDGEAIIEAARKSGADAIWPGWGFLAENASFAKAVVTAGLIWVGPPAAAIEALGDKAESTRIAKKAGVTTIPERVASGDNFDQALEQIRTASQEIGFPLLIKPSLGGGGQGQEVVRSESELNAAIESAFRINQSQFNSGPLLIQKFFDSARHIEAQLLADHHGNVIIFHERECSIQRRNQKIIEESPSPVMTESLRHSMRHVASSLVKRASYSSAGTMEMLYSEGKLYFLEVNTRLQVEHPVTEESCRIQIREGKTITECKPDMLGLMLDIAEGKKLSFTMDDIIIHGHAIETRLYAEDPYRNFQPSPGKAELIRFPYHEHVRIDSALLPPSGTVSPHFDPMIAKVIAWGNNRQEAIARLDRALERSEITGVTTNIFFCRAILDHPAFVKGEITTRFVAIHNDALQPPDNHDLFLLATALFVFYSNRTSLLKRLTSGELIDVAALLQSIPTNGCDCTLGHFNREYRAHILEYDVNRFLVTIGSSVADCSLLTCTDHLIAFRDSNGRISRFIINASNQSLQLQANGPLTTVEWRPSSDTAAAHSPHAAPSGGKIVSILARPGMHLQAGDVLYVTEAMKMESKVRAAHDLKVTAVLAAVGDAIDTGDEVVETESLEEKNSAPTENNPAAEVKWDLPLSHLGSLVGDPLGQIANRNEIIQLMACGNSYIIKILIRYFQGFDIPLDSLKSALLVIRSGLEKSGAIWRDVEESITNIIHLFRQIRTLFSEEHLHSTLYFFEHIGVKERLIPKETEILLQQVLDSYGLSTLKDSPELRASLLRLFQAYRHGREAKMEMLAEMINTLVVEAKKESRSIAKALHELACSVAMRSNAAFSQQLITLIRALSPAYYYESFSFPVATEYVDDYEAFVKNPRGNTDSALVSEIKVNSQRPFLSDGSHFMALYGEAKNYLAKWFKNFESCLVPVSEEAKGLGIHLYMVRETGREEAAKRLVAVAIVDSIEPDIRDGTLYSIPTLEKSVIAAYKMIRLYTLFGPTEPNHLFVFASKQWMIPWSPNPAEGNGLSMRSIKKLSNRVAGFARNINVAATEVIITIADSDNNAVRSLLEIRHTEEVGVLGRPPMPVDKREAENAADDESIANARQTRLGKLLNRDRATLLLDNGQFEELFFPEVDGQLDSKGGVIAVGLNVYKGLVDGNITLLYAGDFRHKGGALGELEGKKLASSVVMAYSMNVPLIGIHDGAGANIKGSVASLGWAGAYFGAIAATGGFSNSERFNRWFGAHVNRAYFEKVLAHFGITSPLEKRRHPLIHIHLHLGAAVGMLVYGPSISSCAIMVDHPQTYRLLTGAATVEKVTGEKSTNYELGGARAHSIKSGEIDRVCSSEEEAISEARRILKLFHDRSLIPNQGNIRRAENVIQPAIPISAGIIIGREALLANVDHAEFFETRKELARAGSILTGYARLATQPVMMAATATDYGLHHPRAFKKMSLAAATAEDMQIPLVVALGANWDRIHPVVRTEALYQQHEMRRMIQNLTVPKIGIALGARSLEKSIHLYMDLVCYVCRGNESDYELKRAHLLAQKVASTFEEAMDFVADILRYLPRPTLEIAPRTFSEWQAPSSPLLISAILPNQLSQPYDMRHIIQQVVDQYSFREFGREDGQPLLAGLATLSGRVVGILADQPLIMAGAQTGVSIGKFTRFNRICERFGIPIIELNDSPAFTPGSIQEHGGIQGEGGKSIREEILSTIPKIAVTLRQNYGGRYIHANLNTLGPPRTGLVLEGARLGVMGSEGAVGVLFGKKLSTISDPVQRDRAKAEWIANYEESDLNPETAVKLGYANAIVAPDDLRQSLITQLQRSDKGLTPTQK